MAKIIMFLAVVAFLAFILHGGIFLIVPAMIVVRMVRGARNGVRRGERRRAQRERARSAWSPRHPYDNL